MNLVDELLKADSKKADELATSVFKSKKLAKLIGAKTDTIDITIQEIKSRRINDIASYQFTSNGKFDMSKSFDAKLMTCIEGVLEPDLKNKDLQKHFECSDARTLCEKLFGMEVNDISDAIAELSGISDDDKEIEIKN